MTLRQRQDKSQNYGKSESSQKSDKFCIEFTMQNSVIRVGGISDHVREEVTKAFRNKYKNPEIVVLVDTVFGTVTSEVEIDISCVLSIRTYKYDASVHAASAKGNPTLRQAEVNRVSNRQPRGSGRLVVTQS